MQESTGNMQDFSSNQPIVPPVSCLGLQCLLAVPIAVFAFAFLLGGVGVLLGPKPNDLSIFGASLALAATGILLGYLSISLFRGRGVPLLVLRTFWLSLAIAFPVFMALSIWQAFNGQIGLRELFAMGLMYVLFFFQWISTPTTTIFWHKKSAWIDAKIQQQ